MTERPPERRQGQTLEGMIAGVIARMIEGRDVYRRVVWTDHMRLLGQKSYAPEPGMFRPDAAMRV
jgi:hypothetical protein